jgi:hypothetical protein
MDYFFFVKIHRAKLFKESMCLAFGHSLKNENGSRLSFLTKIEDVEESEALLAAFGAEWSQAATL